MLHYFEYALNREKGMHRIMGYVTPNDCCICTSYAVEKDTGYIQITHKRKHTRMHRLLYETFFDTKIPNGLVVRHKCHIKTCCNPLHYELGTQLNNSDDNQDNPNMHKNKTELTLTQKRAIVKNKILTNVELAKKYGVPVRTIYKIKQVAREGKLHSKRAGDKPSMKNDKSKTKKTKKASTE